MAKKTFSMSLEIAPKGDDDEVDNEEDNDD